MTQSAVRRTLLTTINFTNDMELADADGFGTTASILHSMFRRREAGQVYYAILHPAAPINSPAHQKRRAIIYSRTEFRSGFNTNLLRCELISIF